MRKQKKSLGFSLVELSVALVVAGFVIYAALAVFTERSAIDKVAVTERKLEEIERAIRIYFKEIGDLPCPADGDLAFDDARFGLGLEDIEGTCNYDNLGFDGPDASVIESGTVPARTLNLPDAYMFDAWGNRITYITSQDCVNNAAWNSCDGDIVIKDNSGNEITDSAIYILVSHGKNGWGAWGRNGGTDSRKYDSDMNTFEQENSHVASDGSNNSYDATFIDTEINDDTAADLTSTGDYFDDIIRWKTKEMIDYDEDRLP